METFSALLAICAGNSPVPGKFPAQRPVTRSFDVFFDLRPNGWVNNREAGDLRHNRAHYVVTVVHMMKKILIWLKRLLWTDLRSRSTVESFLWWSYVAHIALQMFNGHRMAPLFASVTP